ncbi:MAG: hypothetical protein AAF961_15725, partial [Planctomycetota bacterium]
LSRATALLLAALCGLACCYPALAHSTGKTDSEQDEKSHHEKANHYEFHVEFEWAPKYVATLTFNHIDRETGVLTLRSERYPQSRLMDLIKAMHATKHLSFASMTTEYPEHDAEFVTLILESKPFVPGKISAALIDLAEYFTIKKMVILPSTDVETKGQEETEEGNLAEETDRGDGDRFDFWIRSAARSALPVDEEHAGWRIALGEHSFDTTEEGSASDSDSVGNTVGETSAAEALARFENAEATTPRFYSLQGASRQEATRRIDAMKLREADVVLDARANRILVIATAEQHDRVAAMIEELEKRSAKTESEVTSDSR